MNGLMMEMFQIFLTDLKNKRVTIISFFIALIFHSLLLFISSAHFVQLKEHPERVNQTLRKLNEEINKKNVRFVYVRDDPNVISKLKPSKDAPLSDKDRVGGDPSKIKGESLDPYMRGNSKVREILGNYPNFNQLRMGNKGGLFEKGMGGDNRKEGELNPGEVEEGKDGILKEKGFTLGSSEKGQNGRGRISDSLGSMFMGSLKGGYDNPNASRLNSGELSFETVGWDLGPYARIVQEKVESNWRIPAVQKVLRQRGWVAIRFDIYKDGEVRNVEIIKSSKIPSYDNAAYSAIVSSSPFPPLPSFVTAEKITGTFRFFYNMWSEEE